MTGGDISMTGGSIDIDSTGAITMDGGTIAMTGGDVTLNGDSMLVGYPSFFYRSVLINGNFDIWQRGVSFASPVTDSYSADRWKVGQAVDNNSTISRSVTVPDALSQYSIRVEESGSSGGVGAYTRIYQYIENYNLLIEKQVTLTFKAKVDEGVTGTVFIANQVAGANTSINISGTSWATYVLRFTFPAGSTGARVIFQLNRSGLAAGKGFNIAQAQLSVGATAFSYMPPLPADELLRCERYFTCLNPEQATSCILDAALGRISNNTQYIDIGIRMPVRMRTAPIASIKGGIMAHAFHASLGDIFKNISSIWWQGSGNDFAYLAFDCGSAWANTTTNMPFHLRTQANTYGDIWFDAEL
jgi:hypothetical protein